MKIFRIYGIVILLVFVALTWAIVTFWVNGFVEETIEEHGATANGATVELSSATVKWLSNGLAMKDLQIANPDDLTRNRLAVDDLQFDLSILSLLKGQFHVEQLTIKDIVIDGERQTPAKRVEKSQLLSPNEWQWPKTTVESAKAIDGEALLEKVDIRSPKAFKEFSATIETTRTKWETMQNNLPTSEDVDKHKAAFDKAQADLKSAKGLEKIQAAKDLKKVTKAIKQDKQKIADFKNTVQSDIKSLRAEWKALQSLTEKDAELALSIVSLSPDGMKHLASRLLGENVAHWLELALQHSDALQNIAASDDKSQKESVNPRLGQDFYFGQETRKSDFWIKKADLSGGFKFHQRQGLLSGQLENLTNELQPGQKSSGIVRLEMPAKSGGEAATGEVTLALQHPKSKGNPLSMMAAFSRWPIENWVLQAEQLEISEANLLGNMELFGNKTRTELNLLLQLSDFKLKYNESGASWVRHLADLLKSSEKIELSVKLVKENGETNLSVSSDLDKKLLAKIKGEMEQKVARAKQKVQDAVNEKVAQQKANIEEKLSQLLNIEEKLGEQISVLDNLG